MKQGIYIDLNRVRAPALPSDFVLRERLFDQLDAHTDKALTVVCAGAGFGKSCLMAGWLNRISSDYAWIALQEKDNRFDFFLSHVIIAVQQVRPDFGQDLLSLLQASPIPPASYLTTQLKNDLTQFSSPLIIVFDDLHLIKDSEVWNCLQILLTPPVSSLHFYFLSRKSLPLHLAKLRLQDEVFEVDTHALRLDAREMDRFFDLDLSGSMRSFIQTQSEGWIAGLRLFKLHFARGRFSTDLQVLPKQMSHLFDSYFMEEIFSAFSSSCLNSLLKTSILSVFHPRLVDALIGSSDLEECNGRAMIQSLLDANLFLVVLDEKNQWYRFHHLFRDLLEKKAMRIFSKEERKEMHERAAVWYMENQMMDEAFFHAKKAGKMEWIAAWVSDRFFQTLERDQDYLLEDWFSQIPEALVQKIPRLHIVRMWILKDREAFHLLPDLITQFLRLHSAVDEELEGYILFFQGILCFWGGDLEQSARKFESVLNRLLLPKHTGVLGETEVYYATVMQMLGRGDEASQSIKNKLLCKNFSPNYQKKLLGALVFRNLLAGKLDVVLENTYQMKQLNEGAHANPFFAAWSDYILGIVYFYKNKLKKAEYYLSEALKRRYTMDLITPADCFSTQLLVLQAKGDVERVAETVQTFKCFVEERNNSFFQIWFFSVQARLALQNEALSLAEGFFEKIEALDSAQNFLFWAEEPRITYCRLLLSRNTAESLEDVGNLLSGYLERAESTHNVLLQIKIHLLFVIQKIGKKSEALALKHLKAAVVLAMPGEVVQPFFELKDDLYSLLLQIKGRSRRAVFVRHLLDQMVPPRLPHVSKKLTNREMDVIALFEQRLTNQEVADHLSISVATVKRHANSIYQKLKVKNRRQAVLKAVQEGFLRLSS